jgi:hypothetical protein
MLPRNAQSWLLVILSTVENGAAGEAAT